MSTYSVWFVDGTSVTVDADNGTQAKAIARAQRGVKKSELKIASVTPVAAPAPVSAADVASSAQS